MLKDKGVVEFIEAARQLKAVAPHWRFVLAGAARYDNPSAIGLAQLLARKQAVEGRKRTGSAANSAADTSCEQSAFAVISAAVVQTDPRGQEWAKAIFSVASVVSQTVNIYVGVLRDD
jgi:hypothetical protein